MKWPLTGRDSDLELALGSISSGTSIALVGRSGVGKSRLLREVAHRVNGMPCLLAFASESTRTIPFAPFVELLPDTPTPDRLAMFRGALEQLRHRAGSGGLFIGIDDAHHLDPGSLALLTAALESDNIIVCLTARTGESMDSDLVDLWTDGVVRRHDLEPLGRAEALQLLVATLGRVEPPLGEELWRLTAGNPLLLHELIEGATGNSIVQDEDGVWRQTGRLTESARLTDLVGARLEAVPEDLRPALDLVALGAPLSLDLALEAEGDRIGDLEDLDLVLVTRLDDETIVAPAHPLYGELLVERLGQTRRRRAYERLVEAALRVPHRPDELRVAVWHNKSGSLEHSEVAVAGAGAALARHDPVLAETLSRPFAERNQAAGVALGRALNFQRRFEEAEAVLGRIEPAEPGAIGEWASTRAHNLAYGLREVTQAVNLLEAGAVREANAPTRARLAAERGVISAMNGAFGDAEAAGRAVLADPHAPPEVRASAFVSLVLALTMTADCDGLAETVESAYEAARNASTALPLAEDQVGVMEFSALCFAGRIEEAIDLAEGHVALSGPLMEPTWSDSLAIGLELAGRLQDAAEAAGTALDGMQEFDPFGLEYQARGLLALARGQLGDAEADAVLDGIEFTDPHPRLEIWVDRGRCWAHAARDNTDEAAERAAVGGKNGVEGQHYAWGALALHDAVRLGRPELVCHDLMALRKPRGAHLVNSMADHAEALHTRDSAALLRVAAAFGGMGAVLLAAEAAAQAADSLRGVEAARAVCLSKVWQGSCQEPKTPALKYRSDLVSDREVEVAIGAARGSSSPEISRALFISSRTVDNHLGSVYRKLGVDGREALAALLRPAVIPNSENKAFPAPSPV